MKPAAVLFPVSTLTLCLIVSAGVSQKTQEPTTVWVVDRETHALKEVPAKTGLPTYSRANYPIEQTTNYQKRPAHGEPGCACGYRASLQQHMSITPTSILDARVGQPITLRYDASEICLGQTIANTQNVTSPDPMAADNPGLNLGTADWQVGDLQSLPREWGEITLPGGYTQPGSYIVTIKIAVLCKDKAGSPGCESGFRGCSTTVSVVPINVQ
jgi:hypothetical protein